MKIYCHPQVAEVRKIYGNLLFERGEKTIALHLEEMVDLLWTAHLNNNKAAETELSNYLPGFTKDQPIDHNKVKSCIANEYGFDRWKNLPHEPYDHLFENAVDCLLSGDIEKLKETIRQYPKLIHQTSQYGHKATLLHYTASNGVELWRQQVPENLPEIVRFLLDSGANPKAKMKVYRGNFRVLPLLETSAHPRDCGLLEELKSLFI
ncbi:hypothetical protein [Jiulongibacter sediminis]|uniref:Ankyrin n=1 Tax=Jiulongibacter sediminis TaxID=1605367 RepID=A0A0P7C5E1_9BACT|nr:hypothetical protein [Jiulongibacter sediminis]KPM48501.1 hypothetical protein AFM12_07690 [Jiulongibacter sediminis]TBX25039.1 hypothetical protein TK44_07695 [Jiulongibacter sediminis]